MQQPWDDNLYKDKGKKEYVELMKRDECTNLFSKFITRNDYILFDQIITKYFYAETKIPKIIFYRNLFTFFAAFFSLYYIIIFYI